MNLHELKTWPTFFDEVWARRKTFELRRNDRNFKAGDSLKLLEFEPVTGEYTGRAIYARVDYVLVGDCGPFGLYDGYCIMSLSGLSNEAYALGSVAGQPTGSKYGPESDRALTSLTEEAQRLGIYDGVQTSGYVTTDAPPCKTCGTIMTWLHGRPPGEADTEWDWTCPKCEGLPFGNGDGLPTSGGGDANR